VQEPELKPQHRKENEKKKKERKKNWEIPYIHSQICSPISALPHLA
jgi:hypothetical protein